MARQVHPDIIGMCAPNSEAFHTNTRLPDYEQYRRLFNGYAMPLAFVDLDLMGENALEIVRRANGKRIRVATKSIRCVSVLRRILEIGSSFQGLMSYSAAEAVFLSRHGFDDILVAYPTWNELQIRSVCEEVGSGKYIALMVDSVEHVFRLNAVAARHGTTLPICLDIDLSMDLPGLHFGVWRSPVSSVESALSVFRAVRQSPHLRLDGIMGYEAQIAGVGDKGSGVEPRLIRLLKQRSIPRLRELRMAVVDALIAQGAVLRIVNGGGTGSLESTAQEVCVTEVTVGSGFYSPTLFDQFREFRHLPAAGFAIEIVRQPKSKTFTCAGGGYVASGAAGRSKLPQPYLPVGAHLVEREAAGEVQTPIVYAGDIQLQLGDPIFMRHAKAGELCEHFNHLHLISSNNIVGTVPTYRGEGYVFL